MPSFISVLILALASTTSFATPIDLEVLLTRQVGGSTTRNDLSGACKAVTIIFARGTSEGGNVGTVTGPPYFDAVAKKIGAENLAVQGVDYGASIGGAISGGDATGSKTM